jgi:alpha-1,3-mannosyltransferase
VRVVHTVRFYHPRVGGTENFIAALADALAPHGVSSRVVCTTRHRSVSGPAPRIPVTAIPVAGPDRLPKPIGGFGRLYRELRSADLIHVHDIRFLLETSAVLSRLARKPVVLSTHGFIFHTEAFSGSKELLWRRWYAPILRRLDRVIAVSERDAELARRAGVEANVTLLPNPVVVEPFLETPRRASARDGRTLLYFGRIASEKGIDRLAGVLARDPSLRLRVAGRSDDDASVRQIRSAFADVADRVVFTGGISDERLREELARAWCVVLPSRTEAFGLTLVEALAAGAPIVASDIPAYHETAPPSGVELVDADDPSAVLAAIGRVTEAHDPEAARTWARGFSWAGRAGDYLAVYEDAIRRRRR